MRKKAQYLQECLYNDSPEVIEGEGKNIILPPEKEPLWKQYLEKFKDPIIIVFDCVTQALGCGMWDLVP